MNFYPTHSLEAKHANLEEAFDVNIDTDPACRCQGPLRPEDHPSNSVASNTIGTILFPNSNSKVIKMTTIILELRTRNWILASLSMAIMKIFVQEKMEVD